MSKIVRGLYMLTAILLILFPALVKYTCRNSQNLPDSWLFSFCDMDLRLFYLLVFLAAALWLFHVRKISLDYQRKRNSRRNLAEEEFDLSPELFTNRILELCGGECIAAEDEEEASGRYVYRKRLCSMEIASVSGTRIDYFAAFYGRYTPHLSVFFIDSFYTKKEAIAILIRQGFFFAEEKDHIIHFYRDDLHIRMAFSLRGLALDGIEICRGNAASRLPDLLEKEFEEFSD